VYTVLRAMAARQMSDERAGHTLSPTALVNEAYVKLADVAQAAEWKAKLEQRRFLSRRPRAVETRRQPY
jgi:ECF sigma factor